MGKHNFDTEKPEKHEPMGKEEVVRDEVTGTIAEVRSDEQVSRDSDHAVQIPDEVDRDRRDWEDTRTGQTPEEAAEAESKKSSKSSSKS